MGNIGWLYISAKEILWGRQWEVQRRFITEEMGVEKFGYKAEARKELKALSNVLRYFMLSVLVHFLLFQDHHCHLDYSVLISESYISGRLIFPSILDIVRLFCLKKI